MPTTTTKEGRAWRAQRILQLHAKGLSEREIAREVGVSRTTVWTIIQRAKKAAS